MGSSVVVASFAATLVHCSLFLDTGGLAGSDAVAAPDSGASSSGSDGGAKLDAGADASSAKDAGGDASVASAYAAAVLADAPAAYFRLEEPIGATVADEMKKLAAIPFGEYERGVPGAFPGSVAMQFKGQLGGISVGNVYDMEAPTPLTIEMWARIDAADGQYRFLYSKNFYDKANKRQEYGVFVRDPDGIVWERYVDSTGKSMAIDMPAFASWHHYVVAYDGSIVRLYSDGVLLRTVMDARASMSSSNQGDLVFGAQQSNAGFLQGAVDEIAIYDKTLPAERVAAHWTASRP